MSNIVDVAVQAGNFKTLIAALEAAGLVDTLRSEGPWTVFAPNDEAIAKLPAGTVDALLRDIPRLKSILLYHVVSGEMLADDVLGSERLQSAMGEEIVVSTEGAVMVNDANVIQTDIMADNGVIHVIDAVLMPKVAARTSVM